MEFNKAQEEAINTIDGALLIISCPGSGKTTTMLRRIEHMVDVGIPADRILMVTFTEAAAREMKERFRKNRPHSAATFCTIHSLCLRIVNESGKYRGFHIADAQELNEITRNAVRSAGLYLEDMKRIKNDISRFKNTGDKSHRTEVDVNDDQFTEIINSYEQQKNAAFALDFDDLLIIARELLQNDTALRESYSDSFRYIICDEYQDTNPIQKDVLYLLAEKYGNLCVVGDDDQSIYGFRGAVPGLMIDFPKDFPGCKVIKMGTNYRSLPFIIEPAGKLIGYNRKRFEKDITASRSGEGSISFISASDREAEIDKIIERISAIKDDGRGLSGIAILARTNQQLEDVASALIKNDIPFTGREALSDIYESWMFTDICTYLKIADGKFTRRDVMRIANRPKRYLDMRVMSTCTMSKPGIMEAYAGAKDYVIDNLYDFFRDIKVLSALPFSKRVSYILENIGYRKYVSDYCQSAGASATIHEARLNTFLDESAGFADLSSWQEYAAEHIRDFKAALQSMQQDGVTLSTMHRSKGLEWDTVFIIDCCDGNVPLMYAGKVSDMEEERRLFYVACTRAKNELYICSYDHAKSSKGVVRNVLPSNFVNDLRRICSRDKEVSEKNKLSAQKAREAMEDITLLDGVDFKVGVHVRHRTLGDGVIISVAPAFYSVRFARGGTKMFHTGKRI